jgi:membrane peptidoglycan carboxypeptidase
MKRIFKLIKNIIAIVLLIVIIGIVYILYDGYNLYKNTIEDTPLSTKVEEIKNNESYLTYDEIPTLFINAIVSVEDHRFYEHKGFDVISFARAMTTNIKEKELVQGGSTLTQQLAKNMYFSFEKKFTRKIAELLVAFDLEKNYSKDEIITLYINSVYFGDGYYGLKEASIGYFNKEPLELSEDEITLLAGIPNAPSVYALSSNEELARKRQKVVIDCLNKYSSNDE